MSRKELEAVAIDAHEIDMTWGDFWPGAGGTLVAMEPHDPVAFDLTVRLPLLSGGNTVCMVPVGDTQPRFVLIVALHDTGAKAQTNLLKAGEVTV